MINSSAIRAAFEQKLGNQIRDIKQDVMDNFVAPPIDPTGLNIDQCLDYAKQFHLEGNVGSYLYYLLYAELIRDGLVR